MIDTAAQRTVPGAPPSAPLSKSQLKRLRKAKSKNDDSASVASGVEVPDTTAAALIEKAPEPADIQEGSVAPELVTESPSQEQDQDQEVTLKPSPIIELISKRLKATNKKIMRITSYATADPETLNDDQKRTLNTLPALEAVVKELGEVKKAIETHEAELVQDLLRKRQEADAEQRQKIEEAVAHTQ
ncbi:hypothetical protein V5O48_005672, partial [Marasmius crinis-equi]